MTLKKQDIAEAIRANLGVPHSEAGLITESILKVLKNTLASGEDVLISRFGKFQINDKDARKGRNPKTGETMILESRRVVTFKPSEKLRNRLNGGR